MLCYAAQILTSLPGEMHDTRMVLLNTKLGVGTKGVALYVACSSQLLVSQRIMAGMSLQVHARRWRGHSIAT